MKRAAILKGEAGIGGKKRKDVAFDDAAKEFLVWAKAEKKPKTAKLYGECLTQLKQSFAGKRLSELHPFLIEKHKRARHEAGAKVMPNRELSVFREIFYRAIALGTYEGDNPVKAVKRLKETRPLPRARGGGRAPGRASASRTERWCSWGFTRACA